MEGQVLIHEFNFYLNDRLGSKGILSNYQILAGDIGMNV